MATVRPQDGLDTLDDVSALRTLNWTAYALRSSQRIAMLHGMWLNQLKKYVGDKVRAETWQIIQDKYAWNRIENVLRGVIIRTATVYNRPAYRALLPTAAAGTDREPDPAYAAAIRDSRIDTIMRQALHYTMACGMVLIRPWVRDGVQLRFQLLYPENFTPIMDWDDPSCLAGVRVTTYWAQDSGKPVGRTCIWDMQGCDIARAKGKQLPDYLSPEGRQQIAEANAGLLELDSRGAIVRDETGPAYPYRDAQGRPMLPFAVMRTQPPPDLLCNPAEGRDLQDATLQSGKLSVEMYWKLTVQAHLQLVITGQGADKLADQALSPHAPLLLSRGDAGDLDAKVLSLESDPQGHLTALDRITETVLLERGWSLADFKRTAQVQSADAMLIEDEGKREYRALLESMCRDTERELARAVVTVWNADAASSLPRMPVASELLVNFSDPTRTNVLGNLDAVKALTDLNLVSVGEVMLNLQPDLGDRESAMTQLETNRQENQRARARGLYGAAVVSQTPPPNPAPTGA